MYLQLSDFRRANEVLYALHAVNQLSGQPVSKLGLQKLLYLSACFAPIKDIVLSMVQFSRWHRGPYSPAIQNTVDQLVAYDLVKITEFKQKGKYSTTYYNISKGGIEAVSRLKKYSIEEEKAWWIDCIAKISILYSEEPELQNDSEFSGLDTIVRLVYQESTFKSIDEMEGKGGAFDFALNDTITAQIINMTKKHLANAKDFDRLSDRALAELILLSFFEQLFLNVLDSFE